MVQNGGGNVGVHVDEPLLLEQLWQRAHSARQLLGRVADHRDGRVVLVVQTLGEFLGKILNLDNTHS